MDAILMMMSGKMSMEDFIPCLQNDADLQTAIRNLIPEDAKNNPNHTLWKKVNYDAFRKVDFDLFLWMQKNLHFSSSMGDALNIFGTLKPFVEYCHEDFNFTKKFEVEYDSYLDIVGETYEGPEVEALLETIVRKSMNITKKKERIQTAKHEIIEIFHIAAGKKPRWINGGEWPMGVHSPMKFIKQENRSKTEDRVLFYFQDVETNEIRIISQYY